MSYFRITAYHPQEDISVILDSNGRFEKLWEFSAHLLQKGFKIIEVSKEDGFKDGTIARTKFFSHKILLRATQKGKLDPKDEEVQQGKHLLKVQIAENYYCIIK